MNLLATVLAKAGINVGTATGAGAGEVRASGDVFALGKAKGLQAQMVDYTLVDGTTWLNLTTGQQVLTGCTLTFTPSLAETVLVWFTLRLNCAGGTAVCNAGDLVRSFVYVNGVAQGGGVELMAPGANGEFAGTHFKKLSLSSGTAYTIDVRAANLTGNRGQGVGHMMVLRLAG